MLGGQYAASRSPRGLKRLIIANSPASIELVSRGTDHLLNQFPEDFVQMIRKHEAAGTTSSEEYQAGCMRFYAKHVCTVDPWPEELMASFAAVGQNPTVYHTM